MLQPENWQRRYYQLSELLFHLVVNTKKLKSKLIDHVFRIVIADNIRAQPYSKRYN